VKVVPVKHGLEDLVGKNPPGYVRGVGLHMSEIYNDLYQDLEPKRYQRGTSPDMLRMEAGLALEAILEEGLKKRLCGERPGEFTDEDTGIIFSPDLVVFNGSTRVGEMKLTWLSSREMPRTPSNNLPPKFSKYTTQMMAYCRCLDTPYARLIGFFINGSYDRKRGLAPELLAWDIEFTSRELDENWKMLINHAKRKGML
jgi:hypothetical protein